MDAMSENIAWGRERDAAFAKEQAAIAAERELPSYREAEMDLPQHWQTKDDCECHAARAAGRLVCSPCAKQIAAEVKEHCDKAFDEVAEQMNLTRAQCGEMLRQLFATRDPKPNDRQATDGVVSQRVGQRLPGGDVPSDSRDA
jgi:hypothetical protein